MARKTCPRCRLDLVRFTREVKLPRFTMVAGEEWSLPQSAYTKDGGALLGCGEVPAGAFEIVKMNEHRAIHRDCTGVWPQETR